MTITRSNPDDKSTLLDHLVGQNVFVRTVTFHYTGRLSAYDDAHLELADAAWVADSGRFADALADGTLVEVEPYPGSVLVGRGAIVDVSVWDHPLPREQK